MKTNLDNLFKLDDGSVDAGVWCEVSEGTKFLVKYMSSGNPAIAGDMAKLYRPYVRQVKTGSMDVKKSREITRKIFVKHCLIGWEGVEIEGEIIPFSKDTALKVLEQLPELQTYLISFAEDRYNFAQREDEEFDMADLPVGEQDLSPKEELGNS